MAQKVLYREWRPRTFDEVVGQEHVVKSLRQSVIRGEHAHAYLFSGTRGTGKTSLAKIFARAVNCKNPDANGNPCNSCEVCKGILDASLLDVVEMDAASNNSVDNIRKITDEVLFLPNLAKCKVYIIDEVHMLSTAAFNALLKTLEEPPAHVIFILATTDPQRIPATILSRCQRYDFKRIPADSMAKRLKEIALANSIEITDDALKLIISRSEGALRDAISILDQSRSVFSGEINRDDILQMTGVVNDDLLESLVLALHNGDTDTLLERIDFLISEGGDLQRFVTSLSSFYRDILVCKTAKDPKRLLMQSTETIEMMQALAKRYTQASLIEQIRHLTALQVEMKQSQSPRITLEISLIEMLNLRKILETDAQSALEVSEGITPTNTVEAKKTASHFEAEASESQTRSKAQAIAPQESTPQTTNVQTSASTVEKEASTASEKEKQSVKEYKDAKEDTAGTSSTKSSTTKEGLTSSNSMGLSFDLMNPKQEEKRKQIFEQKASQTKSDNEGKTSSNENRTSTQSTSSRPQSASIHSETVSQGTYAAAEESDPSLGLSPPPEDENMIYDNFDDAPYDDPREESALPEEYSSLGNRSSEEAPLEHEDTRKNSSEAASTTSTSASEHKASGKSSSEASSTNSSSLSLFPEDDIPLEEIEKDLAEMEEDALEDEEEINLDLIQTEEEVDIEALWAKFMRSLSDSVPLLAILLNGFERSIEKKSLVLEIPQDSKAIYDKINDAKTWQALEKVFVDVAPNQEWRLKSRFHGDDEAAVTSTSAEADWISRIKETAKRLDIPVDETEE